MNNDFFMSVPGDPRLGFTVNLPAALRGEQVHSLPPYAPVRASKVDCYPGAPAEWPRSTGNTASYFIPIVEGRGMWLDFNACWAHPHHVAIVVSIQGVNPLTGHKADKLELERYAMDSSVEEWLRGRQNYLSTTATPQGMLWIDGFRAADGTVRQYIFTKDENRGVASQIIGVDRVFAIGVAFFLSKEPKPVVHEAPRGLIASASGDVGGVYFKGLTGAGLGLSGKLGGSPTLDYSVHDSDKLANYCADSIPVASSGDGVLGSKGRVGKMRGSSTGMLRSMASGPSCSITVSDTSVSDDGSWDATDKIEIAAGAQIAQELYKDTVAADYWQTVCAGIIAVSYAPAALIKQIFDAGMVAEKEGFLAGLAVGAR